MKKKTEHKMRLGIFVSASIALLIAGIYFIGEKQQLFNTTFSVSAIFKDINGLQIGNNVRFSGINIGIIENIEQITDTTVRVDMVVDENSRKFIKKNAKALIGSDGLMGNKIITIIPGAPGKQVIVNNDVLETAQTASMDAIMVKVEETFNHAATITSDLSIVMKNISEGKGAIGKILMDSAFAENVDAALINIRQGAGGFKKNMDAAGHNILLRGFLKKDKK